MCIYLYIHILMIINVGRVIYVDKYMIMYLWTLCYLLDILDIPKDYGPRESSDLAPTQPLNSSGKYPQ